VNILKMIHEGSSESKEAVALSSHRGRDATLHILNQRYYWPSMTLDTKQYIKECNICQRVNPARYIKSGTRTTPSFCTKNGMLLLTSY